jgi:hypothetical protein
MRSTEQSATIKPITRLRYRSSPRNKRANKIVVTGYKLDKRATGANESWPKANNKVKFAPVSHTAQPTTIGKLFFGIISFFRISDTPTNIITAVTLPLTIGHGAEPLLA